MPRGVFTDAEHLHDILDKGVLLSENMVDGSVDLNDSDPVNVGIIVDVSGYGPHVGALYVDQNRYHASPDTALQAADEMLTEWLLEYHANDGYLDELEEEWGDEWMDILTENFDGWGFQVSPQEFVRAIAGTKAEGLVDIRPLEEEELEEAPRGARRHERKAQRREQSYGSFIVELWSGQTGRFHDMPRAQEWALSRLKGAPPGAYAAFYRAPVARGEHPRHEGMPWTEPFHVLVVNEYGIIRVAGKDDWPPDLAPRREAFPYRGAEEARRRRSPPRRRR